MGILEKLLGDPNQKEIKKLEKIADQVLAYDEAMQKLSDDELRAKTEEFKDRCQNKGEYFLHGDSSFSVSAKNA